MNKSEFLKIFLPKKNEWFRYAILLLNDQMEAEEAVQDVYLKLWNARDGLDNLNNLDSYSFKVLRNLCYDKLRKMRVVISDLEPYMETIGLDNGSQLEFEETENIISEIVSRLPESQRLIVQLRNIEDYSIEDIAKRLGMKRNTVEVNLSRARKKIREQLEKIDNYGKSKL